jgi:hypothetical protein
VTGPLLESVTLSRSEPSCCHGDDVPELKDMKT